MRFVLGPLASLSLLALACAAPAADRTEPSLADGPVLAIEGVRLLDPVNQLGGAAGPATVVIEGDRIVTVTAPDGVELPDGAERVDGRGLYLLPGLWDLHTHLAMADPSAPPLLVSQGVTGVRDLGGPPEEVEALRERIRLGEILGPRMVRAGPTLNGAPNGPHHRVLETAEEARRAVADLAAAKMDLLKVHNAMGREAYFALLEAAREAGLEVAGHVPVEVDPLEACAAGHASMEHIATIFEGTYLGGFDGELEAFLAMPDWVEDQAPELVRCMAENGTVFVPTLRAYELRADWAAAWDDPDPRWRYVSREGYARWRESAEPSEIDRRADVIKLRRSLVDVGVELVRRLDAAGAPIGTGVDLSSSGLLAGFDLHAEVRLLARALGPRGALRAATRGPGPGAGGDPLQGQLVAGAPADLVLLGADAFADLAALDEIEGVVLRGRLLNRAALDTVLSSLENPQP